MRPSHSNHPSVANNPQCVSKLEKAVTSTGGRGASVQSQGRAPGCRESNLWGRLKHQQVFSVTFLSTADFSSYCLPQSSDIDMCIYRSGGLVEQHNKSQELLKLSRRKAESPQTNCMPAIQLYSDHAASLQNLEWCLHEDFIMGCRKLGQIAISSLLGWDTLILGLCKPRGRLQFQLSNSLA